MFIRCSVESVMWIVSSWQWCDVNRCGDWGEVHRRCVSFSIWKRCSLLTDGSNVWDSHKPDWSQVDLPQLPQRLIFSWYQWELFVLLPFSQKEQHSEVSFTEKKYVCRPVVLFNLSLSCCRLLRNVYCHIADVIFSHYWWRLSLMRWAGKKQGMALGNDLKQIKLSLHAGR